MFSLSARFRPAHAAALLVAAGIASGCVIEQRVRFEVRIDDAGCAVGASPIARYELFLLPLDPLGRACVLERAELSAAAPEPLLLETGALDEEELVVLALVFTADAPTCARCHALARVQLRPELTRYTLGLGPTSDCAIPDAALTALGLPPEPLPPTRACGPR